MDPLSLLLDTDILGYVDPLALVVVWAIVEAVKRSDKASTRRKGPRSSTDRRRRGEDHGRLRWLYPFLPFASAGLWFGVLAAVGGIDSGEALVLDIGGHGAFAGSGYAAVKRLRQLSLANRRGSE